MSTDILDLIHYNVYDPDILLSLLMIILDIVGFFI